MKILNFTRTFLWILAISLVWSCADAPKEKAAEESEELVEESTPEADDTETVETDDSFILPSPLQIAAIFSKSGLEFESGLTNPASNISNYNTKTAKYLNFGVYSADLAYVVLNSQQQESIDYMNVVKGLSDDIGMPSIFGSGELIESFERNISNTDTALYILTKIKQRTDQYLSENGEESKEAVFFAAAWLEGMYLGANSTNEGSDLTPRLIEQMTILENIIKAIKVQSDPSLNITFLIDGLSELLSTFEGFQEVKSLEDSDVEFSDIDLTDEELNTLTNQITSLRTKIVNG